MGITKKITVFDASYLTKGSTVKLNGYSCQLEGHYENAVVKIIDCSNTELIVKYKRKNRLIELWEFEIEEISIEMVERIEPKTVELPF
jgi:hypothetical protein